MSYIANQYNYATPLSSITTLTEESYTVRSAKYFTLHDNVLDGTYAPVSGDVGLWGTSVSNASGVLSEPLVVNVAETLTVNAFRVSGYADNYPVEFSVGFYSGNTLVYSIAETSNRSAEYVHYMPSTLNITRYSLTVYKISKPNAVAMLINLYNPAYVRRADTALVRVGEVSTAGSRRNIHSADSAIISCAAYVDFTNILGVRRDKMSVDASDSSMLTNVHTRMKEFSRRVYGKVYITYTDPLLDSEVTVNTNMEAYNSNKEQILDGTKVPDSSLFTLYENDLTGRYAVADQHSQVGWVSHEVSDEYGSFNYAPYVSISFSSRPITPLTLYFDDSHGCVPVDFTVTFTHSDGSVTERDFVGNASYTVQVNDAIVPDVVELTVSITRVSRAGYPAVIIEVPVLSTILYEGYQDTSAIMSIDLLGELTYDDDVEALGGMSANEVTVVLDNSTKEFYANSGTSIAGQLKRNRKIEPWLGVEVTPGTIEWHKQGTFWSYRWDVPVNGLSATVVGFDTIGLLGQTDFTNHTVQRNKSLGELIEYVLVDAKKSLQFLSWIIDSALYDVVVPYAWFEAGSHAAALRKISSAYPMHIYCDKDGNICAAPQKLRLDYFIDTWSDSTNVMSKKYGSLHTAVPNNVSVHIVVPHEEAESDLVSDNLVFNVSSVPTRTLNFSKPYLSGLRIEIDKDSSVTYTYRVYSWGIELTFGGSGTVRSIKCVGTALDVSNTAVLMRKDAESIRVNGVILRDVKSDLIQTSDLAATIIDRIFSLSEYDRYDATVDYRGDIALSINDPIRLLDGIAPDNRYNIRRHKLSWNGALTGTAELNT